MPAVEPSTPERCEVEFVHPNHVDRVIAARPNEDALGRMAETFRACSGGTRLKLLLALIVFAQFTVDDAHLLPQIIVLLVFGNFFMHVGLNFSLHRR